MDANTSLYAVLVCGGFLVRVVRVVRGAGMYALYLGDMLTSRIHGFSFRSSMISKPNNSCTLELQVTVLIRIINITQVSYCISPAIY